MAEVKKSGERIQVGNGGYGWLPSQPNEKRNATQISLIRIVLSCATRFPNRFWDTVTAL
jgi:hypothetical protein